MGILYMIKMPFLSKGNRYYYSIIVVETIGYPLEGKKIKPLSHLKTNSRQIKELNMRNKTTEKKKESILITLN